MLPILWLQLVLTTLMMYSTRRFGHCLRQESSEFAGVSPVLVLVVAVEEDNKRNDDRSSNNNEDGKGDKNYFDIIC